jgi:glutamine synthetase
MNHQASLTAVSTGPKPLSELVACGDLSQIEIATADHQGHLRGKRFPITALPRLKEHGFAMSDALLAWNFVADIADVGLTNYDTGFPDLVCVPDCERAYPLPWRRGAALVIGDAMYRDPDRPVPTSPRAVLRSVLDRYERAGFTVKAALELEFYLLDEQRRPLTEGPHCYSLSRANELEPALGEIFKHADYMGLPVEAANHEYGSGQAEVNLRYDDALSAADQTAVFKFAVKEIARRRGRIATFMAKPFSELSGSSMHVHFSLWRDGEPAFASAHDQPNELMLHSIGGLLEHLSGATLYASPTVNSYKRFEDGSFAPTSANWGFDNRTVSIRALLEQPTACRVEVRVGGADANPYWVLASQLAAALDGIDCETDPGPPEKGNAYGRGPRLPVTLAGAVAAARADTRLVERLGELACSDFALLSESEWAAFVGTVTDWDRDRYLDVV